MKQSGAIERIRPAIAATSTCIPVTGLAWMIVATAVSGVMAGS